MVEYSLEWCSEFPVLIVISGRPGVPRGVAVAAAPAAESEEGVWSQEWLVETGRVRKGRRRLRRSRMRRMWKRGRKQR